MSAMTMELEEQEVLEATARRWWIFLITGIGWLIVSLAIFQWNYTTVYAISILFGCVAIAAGIDEFFMIGVSSTGWKIAHGLLGVLFLIAGIWALVHPHNAFATLAALIGFFMLFKGIMDITVAVIARAASDLWWLQLVIGILEIMLAFWVAGSFRRSVTLLVAYVGIVALSRGITELIVAFKLHKMNKHGVVAA
jgi:uncharacterized membrane protein HdeD (DUF308 family)